MPTATSSMKRWPATAMMRVSQRERKDSAVLSSTRRQAHRGVSSSAALKPTSSRSLRRATTTGAVHRTAREVLRLRKSMLLRLLDGQLHQNAKDSLHHCGCSFRTNRFVSLNGQLYEIRECGKCAEKMHRTVSRTPTGKLYS